MTGMLLRWRQRGSMVLALAYGFAGLVILALLVVMLLLWQARPVVTGYAAKNLCSGLWVSGLPQDWLLKRAILPALQPVSDWLDVEVDEMHRQVEARLAGTTRIARWRAGDGCTVLPQDGSELADVPVLDHTSVAETVDIGEPESDPALELAALMALSGEGNSGMMAMPADNTAPSLSEADSGSLMGAWITPDLDPGLRQALAATLDEAFAEPHGEIRRTLAIEVAWRGQRIAARYRAPVAATTPMPGWSMTKSLLATWTGVLQHQQQAGGLLNTSAAALWPALDKQLTLEHLLRAESGLDFSEWYFPGDDVTTMLYSEADMAAFIASRGAQHAPGVCWRYSSGDSNLAASIWLSLVPVNDWRYWLQTSFWQPLGIDDAVIETDARGLPVTSSYAFMSAGSWLRVGQLWLDAWHNRSELLPDGWMQAATRSSSANRNGNYGLGFWLNSGNAQYRQSARWPRLPASLFWARGHDGQYVLVLPEQELVIVRLGLTPGDADGIDTLVVNLIDTLALAAGSR